MLALRLPRRRPMLRDASCPEAEPCAYPHRARSAFGVPYEPQLCHASGAQSGGSRRTPKLSAPGILPSGLVRLVLTAVALTLVTASACCPASSRKVNAVAANVKLDASSDSRSGEKDFLASLDSADKPDAQTEEAPVYVTLARFGLSLALVLGLAYVTILGLKRFTGLKAPFGAGQGRMRVVENLSLGAGRVLHLVEIGSRRLVVASTPSSVTMVTEIAADELADASSPGPPAEPPTGFKDQLAMFLGGKSRSDESAGNVARILRDSTAFVQGSIGRLGSLRRRLRDAQ